MHVWLHRNRGTHHDWTVAIDPTKSGFYLQCEYKRVTVSKQQLSMLRFYDQYGRTQAMMGAMSTWRSLVNRGWLERSHGAGFIETELSYEGMCVVQELADQRLT